MGKVPYPTLLTAVALVAILVLYMITFQVRFSEAVVKTRFGSADENSVITAPGLHWKWPPPIEMVNSYDMRLRTIDTPETEVKTNDGALIVGCFALWRIADPLHYSIRLGDDRTAEAQLRARINEERDRIVGQYAITDLFTLDREMVQSRFDEIEQKILTSLTGRVRTDYGIELTHVGIRRVALPADATAKALEAMTKARENLATRFRTEGQAKRTEIESSAETKRRQILVFVDRLAGEIRSEGTKATERIFAQIREQDVDFFIFLRRMEAIAAAMAEGTTIFIESDSELFDIFEVPYQGGAEPRDALPEAAVTTPSAE